MLKPSHPHVPQDDPVFHWHFGLWTNSWLSDGLSTEPAPLPHGRGAIRGDLVSDICQYFDVHGPNISTSSLRGQPTLSHWPYIWHLEPAFATFLHPEFYGKPIILETEPDQEFLGFCVEFDPFDIAHLATSTKSWLLFPLLHLKCNFLDSLRECSWSPNARTQDPNSSEVLLHCIGCIARLVSTIQNLTAAAKPIRRYMHLNSLW